MSIGRKLILLLTAAALLFVGCGGETDKVGEAVSAERVRVTLLSDDKMKFDREIIEVPAGSEIELTLKHVGQMSRAAMGHNFVLLQEGTDVDVFALAAAAAHQTEYIPANKKKQVLAYTKMLGGGESDTIVFTAPPPGTYRFLCTFPGHYTMMQGDFVVR